MITTVQYACGCKTTLTIVGATGDLEKHLRHCLTQPCEQCRPKLKAAALADQAQQRGWARLTGSERHVMTAENNRAAVWQIFELLRQLKQKDAEAHPERYDALWAWESSWVTLFVEQDTSFWVSNAGALADVLGLGGGRVPDLKTPIPTMAKLEEVRAFFEQGGATVPQAQPAPKPEWASLWPGS